MPNESSFNRSNGECDPWDLEVERNEFFLRHLAQGLGEHAPCSGKLRWPQEAGDDLAHEMGQQGLRSHRFWRGGIRHANTTLSTAWTQRDGQAPKHVPVCTLGTF